MAVDKNKLIASFISSPQGRAKLAASMINPLSKEITCLECGMSWTIDKTDKTQDHRWVPKVPDSHTKEECHVYSVVQG